MIGVESKRHKFYHKTRDHKYNRPLCGSSVHWSVLVMNDDMVMCKKCLKIMQKNETGDVNENF